MQVNPPVDLSINDAVYYAVETWNLTAGQLVFAVNGLPVAARMSINLQIRQPDGNWRHTSVALPGEQYRLVFNRHQFAPNPRADYDAAARGDLPQTLSSKATFVFGLAAGIVWTLIMAAGVITMRIHE